MAFLHCELFSNVMNMATAVNLALLESVSAGFFRFYF